MPVTSQCVVCQRAIIHHPAQKRVTCSIACRSVHIAQQFERIRYRPKPQAFEAKRIADKRRVEQATQGRFGPMTKREQEIFRAGCTVGYRKGYHRASVWLRKVAA